ncbi:glucosylceramidase-like [Copidosoma floridanum]|uniref:glucosylceramidase-like n=1 Tax=Copidosoma floridanum TaxID=29053 RepID=UPI000C6F6B9C|nr:glucosylceramidase-like [Copidosoma floridanum]
MLRTATKILFIASALSTALAQDCKPVDFWGDSIVCECNATYCDYYSDSKPLNSDEFISYVTSKGGKRLSRSEGNILNKAKNSHVININSNIQYQAIEGFGGAFTDAAGINIKKLSKGSQDNLIRSYFGVDGSKYNFGRVPIAGTDFSTRPYTYDDVHGDVNLTNFTLSNEDFEYKIPIIKQALELNPSLRLVSASWTAPPWMKSNKEYNGFGYLLDDYYQTYANYIVKFLEAYKNNGLEIWAVSTGNEPFTSLVPISHINTMFWSSRTVSVWIQENLGPTLQQSTSNNTQILVLDDQRVALPWYMINMRRHNPGALKYVSGIAVHWYTDEYFPAFVLDVTHDEFPDKFLLMTEFSVGDRPWEHPKVQLGSWSRADRLVKKLFENLSHWVVGWIDWNLALDTTGGPNWVQNYVDAMIIVDAEKDVFYKQPMFYALAHFSKFVPRSSVRIHTNSADKSVLSLAFKTPNNEIRVLLYNESDQKKNITIADEKVGYINIEMPEYSLHTLLYKNK